MKHRSENSGLQIVEVRRGEPDLRLLVKVLLAVIARERSAVVEPKEEPSS